MKDYLKENWRELLIVILAGICMGTLLTSCFGQEPGGMDFSQISGGGKSYWEWNIPEFSSRKQAVAWANEIKWIEVVRRKVKNRIAWYEDIAHLPSGITPHPKQIEAVMHYWQQREYLREVLGIMENYKRHGVKGDAAQVGSVVEWGEYPLWKS